MIPEESSYSKYENNAFFSVALFSEQCERSEQQDSSGYDLRDNSVLITVCDGMGGQAEGRKASFNAVTKMFELYEERYPVKDISSFYKEAIPLMNDVVMDIKDADGKWAQAGSTMISAYVTNKQLYWASVGDSRIYVIHNGIIVRLTTDHNYGLILDEQLARGAISKEQYDSENKLRGRLVSFIGMGNIYRIDECDTMYSLDPGDSVLLVSDGFYRLVEEKDMLAILRNFQNVYDAAAALYYKAREKATLGNVSRDNTTIALIKINK